ncbi:MAG: HIRAN domain-containing protein [Dehalococcoidia bacterium]
MVEVVGESHHQANLEFLAGGKSRESQTIATNAELWREPDNPHDADAIQVLIGGRMVGHLPREEAARYAPALDARDVLAVPCEAEIRGGWKTRWDEGHFGVVLWLPEPDDILRS